MSYFSMRFSVLLLAQVVHLAGCSAYIARQLVEAPNHGKPATRMVVSDEHWLHFMGVDREMRIDVGPPSASLAMWIIEPRDGEGRTVEPRGTILVIHGIYDGPFWMLSKAKDLSEHGYRAVAVSLRGYGGSSGDHRTFGVVEKRDLSQVIDALEREKLCAKNVGVWGMSYGAATAIELAGHDPRVKAVVAVAGFSSMREVVPGTGRLLPVVGWFTTESQWHEAIDLAGERGHFDPAEADAKKAMARTEAAVMIVHGKCDLIVPYANAQRLIAHGNPARTKLVTLPFAGHVTSWMDLDGTARREGLEWLDRWLGAGGAIALH